MKSFFCAAVLLVLVSFSFGQNTTKDPAKTFVSADGGFKLNMSAAYKSVRPETTVDSRVGVDGNGQTYLWESYPITYMTAAYFFLTKEKGTLTALDKSNVLSTLKKATLETLAKTPDCSVTEKDYLFQGGKGFELDIKFSARTGIMRVFTTGRRLYFLTMLFPPEMDAPQFVAVLDSFALLNKEELIAAKIAENTPSELPQTPRSAKVASDLHDEGLKGKVKSIIEDSEEPGIKRERSVEKYYDADGFLLKTIEFDEGYPRTISLWGNVDGKRAVNNGYIDFEEDQRPPQRRQNIMERPLSIAELPPDVPSAASGAVQSPPATKKIAYDESYEYKYDEQKRLTEKAFFDSDNSLSSRTIFKYSPGQIEEIGIGINGGEFYHRVSLLDKNGNMTEDYSIDERKIPSDRYVYEYEFDPQGNWIVKRELEKKTVKGKPVRKLIRTLYRTIDYYP